MGNSNDALPPVDRVKDREAFLRRVTSDSASGLSVVSRASDEAGSATLQERVILDRIDGTKVVSRLNECGPILLGPNKGK